MAIQTRDLCGADNALVKISFTFDDVSGLIGSIIESNAGSNFNLRYTIQDPNTSQNLFGTPRTTTIRSGTHTIDVSALNLLMVFQAGTGHAAGTSGWVLPFNVTCTTA